MLVLDWICVLKSSRHIGVAQALMAHLRKELKEQYHVDTLIGLIAANLEALTSTALWKTP